VGGPAARGMVRKVQELGAGGGPEFSIILRVNVVGVDRPPGLIPPVRTYCVFDFAAYSPPDDCLRGLQEVHSISPLHWRFLVLRWTREERI
jgi:hypothetical protein